MFRSSATYTRSVPVPSRADRPAPESQLQPTLRTVIPGVYSAYVYKNVSILVWFGPMLMEDVATFEQGCQAMCEIHPEGVSSVNIIVPGGRSMPTAEVRSELTKVLARYSPHTAGAAVVIRGDGFWASALRGMIIALSLLLPRRRHFQIFGSLDAAAEWLPALHAEKTGVTIGSDELLTVLQQVERTSSIGRLAA
ncbi:MAG: hypothetical protein ABW321_33065 [Polyangiales bacterium]